MHPTQVGSLHQEVSELTKDLHRMMNLLQTHISVNHHKTSFSSCIPTVSHTGMPADSTFHLHTNHGSLKAHNQCPPAAAQWSCCETAKSQTERHQPCSPPTNSCLFVSSAPKLGLCHSSESMTSLWTRSSPLSPCYSGERPGLTPHGRHEDSRPLSASPSTVSQSHPTLCLQPPSDGDELSCLLSSAATGSSTHSLLDPPSSSYPHVNISQALKEAFHPLSQDASIFHTKDSHTFIHPIFSSSSTLLCKPAVSPLDPGSIQLEVLQPSLTLGSSSSSQCTSFDCLLENKEPMESGDSESKSSRRSSIVVQTQSTDQSWCLDFTD